METLTVVALHRNRPDVFMNQALPWLASFAGPVIVADNSNDPEAQKRVSLYADSWNFRFYHTDNASVNVLRNEALASVNTPYALIVDGDVNIPPETIVNAARLFQENAALVGAARIEETKGRNRYLLPGSLKVIMGSFMLCNLTAWRSVGGFNPFMVHAGWEDLDFANRLIAAGFQVCVTSYVYYHATHERTWKVEDEQKNRAIANNSWFAPANGCWFWNVGPEETYAKDAWWIKNAPVPAKTERSKDS